MAAVTQVVVPDIGDYENVPVIEIHVAPGDAVGVDDPLLTLESDKATMDIPAPVAGTIAELLVKVGDTASMGTVVATIQAAASDGAGGNGAAPAEAEAPSSAPAGASSAAPAQAAAPAQSAAPAEPAAPAPAAAPAAAGEPVYASPTVRRLARELGVDLHAVGGSGRKGRIVEEDVRAAAQGTSAAQNGAGGGLGFDLPPWPQIDFAKYGEVERVPLSKIRKASAGNLARNWIRIPHVTHNEDADITDLEAFRKQLNAEQSEVKVTMVALLLKACAASLAAFPDFNSSLDGDDLVRKRYYNVGFAADTPNGLVVPVVKEVDRKGLLELAGELTELSGKARAGKLGPAEMSGGTFTISSLGGIGGTSFTPIVSAPEVAILGVVRSAMRPVWNGSEFTPRLILPLSLSYDHRVIDGAAAARFCAHLAGVLGDMRRVLL
jgi:pyruvate dehydrogenase E2 component (dihydrolipoamide acetyltransferase)